jgi:SulP family sulfate permease
VYVTILRIHGPFLFGVTNKLEEATTDLTHYSPIVVLRLRNMTVIDGTGLHAIESLAKRLQASGRTLILCGARKQPADMLQRSELPHLIGATNIAPSVEAALERAREAYEGFGGFGAEIAREQSTTK